MQNELASLLAYEHLLYNKVAQLHAKLAICASNGIVKLGSLTQKQHLSLEWEEAKSEWPEQKECELVLSVEFFGTALFLTEDIIMVGLLIKLD